MFQLRWLLALVLCANGAAAFAQSKAKPHHLPPVDVKQRILWGSEATTPEGLKLSFGGLDQEAADGQARTRLVDDNGEEIPLKVDTASEIREQASKALAELQETLPLVRFQYLALDGRQARDQFARISRTSRYEGSVSGLTHAIERRIKQAPSADNSQLNFALQLLRQEPGIKELPAYRLSADLVRKRHEEQAILIQVLDSLSGEPSARALSPLVYDPHTKLFVLFGGDHLDYVMNDLWVFDPKTLRWEQRHPPQSPAPRANHKWRVLDGGKLELSGGYRYTSSTDYTGGQYIDHNDGPWVYDVAKNEWSGEGKLVASDQREYRTGPFHPDYFLQSDPPDASAFQKKLAELPANTWVATNPPYLPQLNRDWGTAVMAGDDLILRWAGGHSAHGGTDVLHYHTTTNRWELTRPVEFPLGQLYNNTEYPRGVSFNGQAWITGHTYQSYAFSAEDNTMLFVGQKDKTFIYDPAAGSWHAPGYDKPTGMNYGSCFYTLTLCPTDVGVICWTNEGRIFQWLNANWKEWKLTGRKLPGSSVDNSTLTYDSKRKRLYFFTKPYGDNHRYDGVIHTLDLETKEVGELKPAGADAAAKISYLCQIRYDAANDLLLCGCTLPPDEEGVRRTPAYDPEKNRWISLKITGEDPSGPKGRNVSLGLMYDARRKLFWAVDAKSQVFVMHLHRVTADMQLLK